MKYLFASYVTLIICLFLRFEVLFLLLLQKPLRPPLVASIGPPQSAVPSMSLQVRFLLPLLAEVVFIFYGSICTRDCANASFVSVWS